MAARRARLIQGDAGEFTSFTDPSRQADIDQILQIWNEVIDELFDLPGANVPRPKQLAQSTVTLLDGVRDYSLPSNFLRMYWPIIDYEGNRYVQHYPGDFLQFRKEILNPDTQVGFPVRGFISPVDNKLVFDFKPTSEEDGTVLTFVYDRDAALALASDVFPFNDAVTRSLVPVVVELFKNENRKSADGALLSSHFARAARYLVPSRQDESYYPIQEC